MRVLNQTASSRKTWVLNGLLVIFFLTGFSSLIYQIVWQRLLTLYYGVGSVSIALIVSVYMLGLGIGSLAGGYWSERAKDRFFFFAVIELLIGLFGMASIPFLDFLGRHTAGSNYTWMFIYNFLFLCFPTFLMGITLPLLTKIYNQLAPNFMRTVSVLYFINTLGAALGCLFASYFLISFFGLGATVMITAVLNIVLAGAIYGLKFVPHIEAVSVEENVSQGSGFTGVFLGKAAYTMIFITGFLDIGYQIIWMRIISVMIKDSPYAFSSVLFVYLLGVALGSLAMAGGLKRVGRLGPKNLFFLIQGLIALSVLVITLGYYVSTHYPGWNLLARLSFNTELHPPLQLLPFHHPNSMIRFFLAGFISLDIFLWPFIFLFIPTFLMGANFPLISYLAFNRGSREGHIVGAVFFSNILGNVAGGILTTFLLMPWLGTERTIAVFAVVGLCFIFLIKGGSVKKEILMKGTTGLLILGLVLIFSFLHGRLYRAIHVFAGADQHEIYFEEGVEGISLFGLKGRQMRNFINGVEHGHRPGYHFYHKAVETLSYPDVLDHVLVIGLGTGSFVETALASDETGKVTVVEIHSPLLKNLKKTELFRDMLGHKKVDLIIDDGRRFLLQTRQKFDVIFLDPARSTAAYTNNLSSIEFFELVRSRLSPSGVLFVWFDRMQVLPKTILSVFPYVRMYRSFCLASNQPFDLKSSRRQRIFLTFPEEDLKQMISYYQSKEPQIGGLYLGDQDFMKEFLQGIPVNRDLEPVLEYYIGLKYHIERSLKRHHSRQHLFK